MVTAAKVKVLTNVCALVVCCACYVVVVVVVAVVDVRGDYLWLTTLQGSVSAAMELLTPLLLLQSTGMGVVAALMMALGSVSADTTDFSNPIWCYTCRGPAVNSSCADPVNPRTNIHLVERECDNGVCLKWTKYDKGVLQMIRTCSADLNFYLTLIDGVCRTERSGNGYLCMCGKHLCNAANPLAGGPGWTLAILLVAWLAIAQQRL